MLLKSDVLLSASEQCTLNALSPLYADSAWMADVRCWKILLNKPIGHWDALTSKRMDDAPRIERLEDPHVSAARSLYSSGHSVHFDCLANAGNMPSHLGTGK